MLAKAEEAIAQMCEQKVSYKGQVNPLFFRQLWQRITTGRAVVVEYDAIVAFPDGGNSVELRIQAFTRSVNDDLSIDIEISDTLYISRIARIEGEVRKIKNDANERIDLSTSYTRRRWRDVQKTIDMMFDPEGNYFSEMIKPLIVQTAQLIAGTNSQQFDFRGVRFKPNYNNNPNDFRWDAGYLNHFAIDPSGVRTWSISAGSITLSANNAYYVYAYCPKTTNAGLINFSTAQYKLESVSIDPPYLSTDSSTYSSDGFWRLKDYLDVLRVLDGADYVFFTSDKSSIVELLAWVECRYHVISPFAGATVKTVQMQLNCN